MDKIIKCRSCGQPLGEIEFTGGFCRRCDNVKCRLYAQCQEIRNRTGEEGEAYRHSRKVASIFMAVAWGGTRRCKVLSEESRLDMDRRKARPGYKGWMEQKKRNYHILRERGYSCQEAIMNSSKKRMKEMGIDGEV